MADLLDIPDNRIPCTTSPSSWTAMAAGPSSAGWSVFAGISRGRKPFGPSSPNAPASAASVGGPDFLTLYSFSLENWKRPAAEVTFLMQMYIDYLRQPNATTMMENNIRFTQIGRLDQSARSGAR